MLTLRISSSFAVCTKSLFLILAVVQLFGLVSLQVVGAVQQATDTGSSGSSKPVVLEDGNLMRIKLHPHETVIFTSDNVFLESSAYWLLQLHTQYKNITVSLTLEPRYQTSVTGHSVGVVSPVDASLPPMWYVTSRNPDSVNTRVYLELHDQADPVPGGCSLEFPLALDPNLHGKYSTHVSTLQFQLASLPSSRSATPPDCEGTAQEALEYDIYQLVGKQWDSSETAFFDTLEKFLTTDDIVRHGSKLTTLKSMPKPEVVMTLWPSSAALYGVVARYKGRSVAYVPISTYGCRLSSSDSCQDARPTSWVMKGSAIAAAVLGLWLCVFGHRFFRAEVLMLGSALFGLAFYLLLTNLLDQSLTVLVCSSVVGGLLCGILVLALWETCGASVITTLLLALTLGYVVAAFAFFSPLGNIQIFKAASTYGIIFACCCLFPGVILLYWTKHLSIVTCSVVGSYCTVFCAGLFLPSWLPYVLISCITRQTDSKYRNAFTASPFELTDYCLAGGWLVLVLLSIFWQHRREREREDFPLTRSQQRARARNPERRPLIGSGAPGDGNGSDESGDRDPSWLSSRGQRSRGESYGSMNEPPPPYDSINHSDD